MKLKSAKAKLSKIDKELMSMDMERKYLRLKISELKKEKEKLEDIIEDEEDPLPFD